MVMVLWWCCVVAGAVLLFGVVCSDPRKWWRLDRNGSGEHTFVGAVVVFVIVVSGGGGGGGRCMSGRGGTVPARLAAPRQVLPPPAAQCHERRLPACH